MVFLRENILESFWPIVAAVGIPAAASVIPKIYIDGWLGFSVGLAVFLGLFYYFLKWFFDLAPEGAIKLIGVFILCRLIFGFVFALLLSL